MEEKNIKGHYRFTEMYVLIMPQKQHIALTALVGNSLRDRFVEMGSMVGIGNCKWFRKNFFEAFNRLYKTTLEINTV